MIFGGLLAGGSGSRMEIATMPKQFIEVKGVPIFIRTLRTFLAVEQFDKVLVSINTDWKDKYSELIERYKIDTARVVLVPGGTSRFRSLINITKAAKDICNSDSIIVTHDCARLFVTKKILLDNLSEIRNYDMVTTSIQAIDTMILSENGCSVSNVPDRSKLWNDQGPQTYRINDFIKYVDMIPEDDIDSYMEAGKLFLSHGKKVGIVKGDRYNFKITNDIDLAYAEFLLEKGAVIQ